MTNTEIIANLATIIAKQNLEISELNTEVQHLHHELLATMNEADRKDEPTSSKMEQVDKDINVRSKTEPQTLDDIGKQIQDAYDKGFLSDADAAQAWYEAVKDEPQTEAFEEPNYYDPALWE